MSVTTLAPGTVIRHALVQLDDFLPADELASLVGTGFAEVDVLWRRGPMCVLAAVR